MSAGRVRTAASLLRDRAEAARSLDWEAAKDLESIGFSDSGVALAIAEWLTDVANWVDYGNTTAGDLRHAHTVADAILGDAS